MELSDIKKLAELARLEISDEEQEKLLKEMDSILGYVSQVKEVTADMGAVSVADIVRNVMREDGEPHETGLYTDELLAEAPSSERGYVKVKNIL